jgi:hypothetical protein
MEMNRTKTNINILVLTILWGFLGPGSSFEIAFAKSGSEHISDYKHWFGGGVANSVAKDLNSTIIDTVPWFSGNTAGGGQHRIHWGHSLEWYFGEDPSREAINAIKQWKGGTVSEEEAIRIYRKYVPKGGGKELLVRRIRKNYPRLSRVNAELIADGVLASHLQGDRTTAAGIRLDQRTRQMLGRLKRPPAEMVEMVISIDAMKIKGKDIADKASKFISSPKNQERIAVLTIAKSEKGAKISNIPDRDFIGFSKNGKDYILCKGDKGRIEKALLRHKRRKVTVTDDLFAKLEKDPKFVDKINSGKIVRESDVLSSATVNDCSQEAIKKRSEKLIAQGEGLYVSGRLKGLYERLPKDVKISAKAGAVAAMFAALSNTWEVLQGEKSVDNAAAETFGTGLHAGSSLYVTNALIQKIGAGKYALSAIVDASTKELIPGVTRSVAVSSAFLNYGIATFIFDQSKSVFFFVKGDMNTDKFLKESAKNLITSSGSGLAAMCAVALNCNPAGFTVMAISIGGYMVVNQAITYAENLNRRNYLFIEDVLGDLPLEMQQRITPWDRAGAISPWDNQLADTPWSIKGEKDLWNRNDNPTPWD